MRSSLAFFFVIASYGAGQHSHVQSCAIVQSESSLHSGAGGDTFTHAPALHTAFAP